MTKNTAFDEEWNKLQKTFLDNVGSSFVNSSNTTDKNNTSNSQQLLLLNQWLTDVDKYWENQTAISSIDIDSLYKKISSSSRFFINFTESITSMKQGETTDVLFEKILTGFTSESSESKTNSKDEISQQNEASLDSSHDIPNINNFWKHPLAFFENQQQSLSKLSSLFEDAARNPKFSETVESYLVALQNYQQVIFNWFKASAIQAFEKLQLNVENSLSPKQIMTVFLEFLEANYLSLISKDTYSQAYAEVVNSWMLMLSKSNIPFTEFLQTVATAAHIKPDGQTDAK